MRLPLLALLACAASWPATLRQFDVEIPMRDGVRLSANVFRPDTGARVPAILIRTPYGKGSAIDRKSVVLGKSVDIGGRRVI